MEYIDTKAMQALEQHAFTNYPITLEQMMQNAGKAVFDVVILGEGRTTSSCLHGMKVLVVAGKGNNGGDALVTARLLDEAGIKTMVYTPYPDKEFSEMARVELDKVEHLRQPVVDPPQAGDNTFSLIIDALFGFSLKGDPRPPADQVIEQINCSSIPTLSVDVPSGLDVHDGSIGNPCIKADRTVALGMLKKGFEDHSDYAGKVFVGDLGIPKEAYEDLGYKAPIFKDKTYCFVN